MLEATKQVQVDPRRREQDRDYGYRLFEAGQPKSYCTNIDQVRGWNQALNACAYAETSFYLVANGLAQ